MKNTLWDVAVVGAGAAGLMTAIHCRSKNLKTLLLDGREKIGAKILMSGGTRCNVTNRKVSEADFASESIRHVRNILRSYPSEKAVAFFEDIGVTLIQEKGGKYFPSTHSSRTVLDALLKKLNSSGAVLLPGEKVTGVRYKDKQFELTSKNNVFKARSVVLATGGLSYPSTGSDGTGYKIASQFGHSLVATIPALTPFTTDDVRLKQLSGVAIPCRLTLFSDHKKILTLEDDFLFTHFGFSGPVCLDMSRHWLRVKDKPNTEIRVHFLPPYADAESLKKEFQTLQNKSPSKSVRQFLKTNLPDRLISSLFSLCGIPETRIFGELTRDERARLLNILTQFPLPVKNVYGYSKAEVTAGGVNFLEIDSKTLESKHQPGLFFAGEILDVDGKIGGFNFQWAWSSGVAAAEGAAKYLSRLPSDT